MAKKLEILHASGFAELMGVNQSTVTKWINTGKITDRSLKYTEAGKPKIIVEYAVQDLEKNQNTGAVRRTKTGLNFGGNTRPDKKVQPPPPKEDIDKLLAIAGINQDGELEIGGVNIMDAQAQDFHIAKIQEQIGKAEMIKLLLKEKRGSLVDKEAQAKQLALLGVNLKSYLNTLADRIAAPVHAIAQTGTELDVRNAIHAAIEHVLVKFSSKVWE